VRVGCRSGRRLNFPKAPLRNGYRRIAHRAGLEQSFEIALNDCDGSGLRCEDGDAASARI
jgi:hypothetical protein